MAVNFKEHEKQELRKYFNECDQDHNGYINKKEFEKVLLLFGWNAYKGNLAEIYKNQDLDGDGRLSFDEFLGLMWKGYDAMDVEADRIFTRYDKDRNGFLSVDELTAILEKNGEFSEEKISSILVDFDRNKDGKLSLGEFKVAMRTYSLK